MNIRLILLALSAAPTALSGQVPGTPDPSRATAGAYSVDPAHTQVTWKLNHLGFSMLQGQFGASGGSLSLDPAKVAASKVEVTFDMKQLSTTAPGFTKHLNSADFFDTAKFGTARFVSTSIKPSGKNAAVIVGNLTIKDVTKPVTLNARFLGAGSNPMANNALNGGFSATGKIKRSAFGVAITGWIGRKRVWDRSAAKSTPDR